MRDNPLDDLPAFDRVSIRAVLVRGGEDPSAALAEAGIFDPIALPVVIGDDAGLFGGILGDGITRNLTGVLETVYGRNFDLLPSRQPEQDDSRANTAPLAKPVTTTLPAAFGRQAFAPVRRQDDGQTASRSAGRYGDRTNVTPPIPSIFMRSTPLKFSGQCNLALSAGEELASQVAPVRQAAEGSTNAAR